jgi:hypothetical protein
MNNPILAGTFQVNLRSERLLICLTLFCASVQSAPCFNVVAFTTSTPVPRFGRSSEIFVLVTRRFGHHIDFTPEQIRTFRSKIEKLELPEPPSLTTSEERSAKPQHFTKREQAPRQQSEHGSDEGGDLMRDEPDFGSHLEGFVNVPVVGSHLGASAPTEGASSKGAFSLPNFVAGLWRGLWGDEKVADTLAKEREIAVVVGSADTLAKEREIAVVVGSAINVCESDVESDLRELVHSYLLLAQLYARKRAAGRNCDAYWAAYWNVLVDIAWLEVGHAALTMTAFENHVRIHRQIIPFLTAAFVPATPAATILTGIIQGLGDMDATSPWVTLFEHSATNTDGACFQFSTTSISPDNMVLLDLLSVSLKAGTNCTHALFAAHATANAQLKIDHRRLQTTPTCLRQFKATMEARVAAFKQPETARLFRR